MLQLLDESELAADFSDDDSYDSDEDEDDEVVLEPIEAVLEVEEVASINLDGRSPLTRITSSVAENILTGLIDRITKGQHIKLDVHCAPNGNALDLLRGHFQSDASVEFDRLVFPCIRISGGRLEAQRLAVNLWSFTPSASSSRRRRRRYPNQFDFVAHDVKFTQDDLFESNCIRNGLRRLLVRILKKHMTLSSVEIS